jgi:outer membrane protein TolC
VLKLGIDNLPVTGPDQFSTTRDFMTMRRIGIVQEITRGAKRDLRSRRYESEAEKSIAEKSATLAEIQRDTAFAWLDRYYAEAMLNVLRGQIGQARLEVQAAEAAYRGARASQADVFAAHGSAAALEDRASELSSRVRVAKANLARWIGEGADATLADPPPMDTVPLEMATLETNLAHHPEMVALAKQEEIAETEARLAQASSTPDWTVEIAYQQRGPDYSNMVSFGVSLPLPWDRGNRQDREIAAKLAQAEQARAQREEALRAHVGEVRAMLAEWQSGRARLARYRGELVPLARDRAHASLAAYQGGKASITELLAARRNESEVRLQQVQLEKETARLWASLSFLTPHTGEAR